MLPVCSMISILIGLIPTEGIGGIVVPATLTTWTVYSKPLC